MVCTTLLKYFAHTFKVKELSLNACVLCPKFFIDVACTVKLSGFLPHHFSKA